jgi:hypothetical protein
MTHEAHTQAPPRPRGCDAPTGKDENRADHGPAHGEHRQRPYLRLAVMAIASFAIMYVLMYAMVDRFTDVYANINQGYMAALMAAPMVVLELLLMSHMYRDRRANVAALALSVIVGVGALSAIRQQTAVGDQQFLLSMIPHHSSALLMCRQANISDPEIQQLCFGPQGIVASQEREIVQMKEMLARG